MSLAPLLSRLRRYVCDDLVDRRSTMAYLSESSLVAPPPIVPCVDEFPGAIPHVALPESVPSRSAIEVHELVKQYGHVRALDGVCFSVAEGEIFGLLGHNGAGKTTTIRILTGRARPTAGQARIAGLDIRTAMVQIRPLINVVGEDQNLYERMTGRQLLRFFATLYQVPPSRADHLLGVVGLDEAAGRKVKTYSSGMKQRLLIARSLINQPRVLFLDEPTRGLDPASAREVRRLIAEQSAQGTTVFLTTHYMEEADELCNRVAFLSQGRIVALDTPRELKLRFGQRTASVLLNNREEYTIRLDDDLDAGRLAGWMRAGRVLTVHSNEGTLEDVFVALAGRSLHD
jgi:ABC-2 type transport system ATP-binding protein